MTGNPSLGITIDKGVFWSVFWHYQQFSALNVVVEDSAAFYFTNTDKSGDVKFGSFFNANLVAISDTNNRFSTSVTISGQMQNNGNLFISNATQVIFSGDKWENNGIISLEEPSYSHEVSSVSISSSKSSLVNHGEICLSNVNYDMKQQLYGGGCIHLFKETLFQVLKVEINSRFDNTIVFNGAGAVFNFIPSGSYYTMAGFGKGNVIAFTNKNIVMSSEYNEQTGILAITCTAGGYVDYFNIGLGYNSTLFDGSDGGVGYKGTPPSLQPPKCGACPSFPIVPSPSNPLGT